MARINLLLCDQCGIVIEDDDYWELRYRGPISHRPLTTGLFINDRETAHADLCTVCIQPLTRNSKELADGENKRRDL